jgi:hypothetical protein
MPRVVEGWRLFVAEAAYEFEWHPNSSQPSINPTSPVVKRAVVPTPPPDGRHDLPTERPQHFGKYRER